MSGYLFGPLNEKPNNLFGLICHLIFSNSYPSCDFDYISFTNSLNSEQTCFNTNAIPYHRTWVDFAASDERRPKKLAAGAIRSYLSSVILYIKFIFLTYPTAPLRNAHLDKLMKRIDMWRSRLWKDTEINKFQRQINDIERFPTPEDFKKFDESDHSQGARSVIQELSVADEITQRKFTYSRDFLLSKALADNAGRPGGVYNMTLLEYRRRKVDPEDEDACIVTVVKHKTKHKGNYYSLTGFETRNRVGSMDLEL
jgi:hypothetical protein